jgi:hypothetical protein
MNAAVNNQVGQTGASKQTRQFKWIIKGPVLGKTLYGVLGEFAWRIFPGCIKFMPCHSSKDDASNPANVTGNAEITPLKTLIPVEPTGVLKTSSHPSNWKNTVHQKSQQQKGSENRKRCRVQVAVVRMQHYFGISNVGLKKETIRTSKKQGTA